jgi:hypothetical protein
VRPPSTRPCVIGALKPVKLPERSFLQETGKEATAVGAQSPGDVTELLERWNRGDQQVAGEVVALVYEELKRIAESQFRREPAGTRSRPR